MRTLRTLVLFSCGLLLPMSALAQGTIAGVVTDTSGAVLPGVTVEASSPVLIEKVRATVSTGSGVYNIPNLRPGTYVVTFTLPGFTTVKREGIELTGSFTATVNTQLKVGAVAETITVSSEAPIVDLQSTAKQTVLDKATIDTVPTSRLYSSLAVLVPGVTATVQDVGGALGDVMSNVAAHGSSGSTRVVQNGAPMLSLQTGGNAPGMQSLNMSQMQEMSIDTSGVSAEMETGGPRINLIPRDGGNQPTGSAYVSFANNSMQGSNFTQRLQVAGLKTPTSIKEIYEVVPAIGGPIQRNKLWFFWTGRYSVADSYPGIFYNKNGNDPNAWTYEADTSKRGENDSVVKSSGLRVTWQATPRNKLAFQWDQHDRCDCPSYVGQGVIPGSNLGLITSPEAGADRRAPKQHLYQGQWTSPISGRMLFEATGIERVEYYGNMPPALEGFASGEPPGMIGVLEQSSNLEYRGGGNASGTYNTSLLTSGQSVVALSYLVGSHNFKMGLNNIFGNGKFSTYNFQPLFYRFNNGVPNQVTIFDTPFGSEDQVNQMGSYVQDKYQHGNFTVNGAVRFDLFKSGWPAQTLGASLLNPIRNLSYPAQDNLDWKDITYRSGAVYNLFGTGKTALRVSMNKYLEGQELNGLASSPNPITQLVTSTTRPWTDTNKDFVVNCNLENPLANGECGKDANANFGLTVPGGTFDPKLINGFGVRPYDWEFSAGVQHEILPRLSVDVAYFRRIFGNLEVTDNLLVSPSDYSPFSVVVPTDSRLPNGGGNVISGLYDLNPNKVGAVQNYTTFSDNYGKQISHWNGFDISVNARSIGGVQLQGGVSTGKTTTDNCAVVTKLDNPSTLYCHQETPFIPQVKLLGSYTIPKIAVQAAATFQSLPGPQIAANVVYANAAVSSSLGRNLSNGANVTVNVVAPGTLFGERLNQLDLRFAKLLKYGRTRLRVNVDIYNVLNVDTVLTLNNNFGAWLTPTSNIQARFVKIGAQFDF